jgi:hypothetical protein
VHVTSFIPEKDALLSKYHKMLYGAQFDRISIFVWYCAAKAFYSCPAIISRRPESQKTPKEPQLNPEEESKIIQARSHVTLEKSSRNHKPSEE